MWPIERVYSMLCCPSGSGKNPPTVTHDRKNNTCSHREVEEGENHPQCGLSRGLSERGVHIRHVPMRVPQLHLEDMQECKGVNGETRRSVTDSS